MHKGVLVFLVALLIGAAWFLHTIRDVLQRMS